MAIITSIAFTDEREKHDIKRILRTYRSIKQLVNDGVLPEMPDICQYIVQAVRIEKPAQTQQNQPTQIELPRFVDDVLAGGAYPAPEECTTDERNILYNQQFQTFYKVYRQTAKDDVRQKLRRTIADLIVVISNNESGSQNIN